MDYGSLERGTKQIYMVHKMNPQLFKAKSIFNTVED